MKFSQPTIRRLTLKGLLAEMRELYARGDEQGVVDLAIEEAAVVGLDPDKLYHMPAYKAAREAIDHLARKLRWAGGV